VRSALVVAAGAPKNEDVSVEEVSSVSEAGGLAAGLRRALDSGVPVPCSASGRTLIPAGSGSPFGGWRLDGCDMAPEQVTVSVLAHPLAATEGLELVQVTPRQAPAGTHATHSAAASLLLAAVRLGLTARMLDLAVRHLAARLVDGEPLTHKQLLQGAIADAATAIELCRYGLTTANCAAAVEALHARLSTVGWSISTLFGGSGYLRDHPVRCLYVAELVHDAWAPATPAVPAAAPSERIVTIPTPRPPSTFAVGR
jgi:hypothetical protein